MSGDRCALLVASEHYDADSALQRLRAPTQDVAELADVLRDPAVGDFSVQTVVDRFHYEVKREIEIFFRDRRLDDLVLLYFTGHGLLDEGGRLYFGTFDTDHRLLRSTAVEAEWVNHAMNECRARRQVLVLDCCHAGAFARGLRAKAAGRVNIEDSLAGRGRFVMTATDAMQFAFEGDVVEGDSWRSVFTRVIVEGLLSGHADRDGDGWISMDEIYDYVFDRVREIDARQTPRKYAIDVEGIIHLARSTMGPGLGVARAPRRLVPLSESIVVGAGGRPALIRARIWGCRGPGRPDAGAARYGVNTPCVEVRLGGGTLIVLDAGSGIGALGRSLAQEAPQRIDLLLTHLHLGHLEGLTQFDPLWHPETMLHIWGPASPSRSLAERITRYFSPPLSPVELADLPARISFHDLPNHEWTIGEATIAAAPIVHPGPTVGFRVTVGARSLAYLPDHEPALGAGLQEGSPEWISGCELASGVDVLLHDAQYTGAEYADHVGFGHSSVEDAVRFASIAGVDHVVLFHHDSRHTDEDLDVLLKRACRLWEGKDDSLHLAHESLNIHLG
jgi:phosphoribosyl 1,2-cyclic phosphodiesterase